MRYRFHFIGATNSGYTIRHFAGTQEAMIQHVASILLEKENRLYHCHVYNASNFSTGGMRIMFISRSARKIPSVNYKLGYEAKITGNVPLVRSELEKATRFLYPELRTIRKNVTKGNPLPAV